MMMIWYDEDADWNRDDDEDHGGDFDCADDDHGGEDDDHDGDGTGFCKESGEGTSGDSTQGRSRFQWKGDLFTFHFHFHFSFSLSLSL